MLSVTLGPFKSFPVCKFGQICKDSKGKECFHWGDLAFEEPERESEDDTRENSKDTNELICRIEADSQTLKNIWLWLPKGTGVGGRDGLGLGLAHAG